MVARLYIAEKPSLGKAIADAVATLRGGSVSKGDGCLTVGDDVITWTRGHAFENAPPQHYNAAYASWNLASLPIIPPRWDYVARDDMGSFIRVIDRCLKQNPREIINVGDAEREGQLIIDEILQKYGIDPFSDRIKRVWIQSMTDAAIVKAVDGAFPNAEKRSLSHAAVARQRADWLHGLNSTRCFAVLVQDAGVRDVKVRVGRVQTPTLKIVVDRDREIENFKAVDHFVPSIQFRHQNGTFKAAWVMPEDTAGQDSEGRLVDKAVAQAVIQRVTGQQGTIRDLQKTPKTTPPPLAFSLGSLQKACFRKFGMQLSQTDETIQSLYEKKLTSYPRTDSDYLPTSLLAEEAPGIIANLAGVGELAEMAGAANLKLKSPVWNDAKVTDHYGIVPTTEASADKIAGLTPIEKRVFMLVAKTFIAQFHPDYRYESTTVMVGVDGGLPSEDRFKATGKRVVDQGWKRVFGAESDDEEDGKDEEEEGTLPAMAKGDDVRVEAGDLGPKRTKPPAYFDDASLVDAMMAIHRFVTDPGIKQRLKESSGIGTPATRKSIIEKLIAVGHLVRKPKGKKSIIVSTKLGRDLIDLLPKAITSPDLTAFWESHLEKVKEGEITLDSFMNTQIDAIRKVIETAKTGGINVGKMGLEPLPGHGETCQACNKGKLKTSPWPFDDAYKGKRYLRCDNYDKNAKETSCRYMTRPEGYKERPKLPGEGGPCPSCGKGLLKGGQVNKKGPNLGRPFLICSEADFQKPTSCQHFAWGDVAPREASPEEGKPCPDCGKGKLRGGTINKDGPNKGRTYLTCTEVDFKTEGACRHFNWTSEPKVTGPKISGEGEKCSKCGKGMMVRRTITKDGPNKGKPFLACNNWKAGASDNCDNRVFLDDRSPRAAQSTPAARRPPPPKRARA